MWVFSAIPPRCDTGYRARIGDSGPVLRCARKEGSVRFGGLRRNTDTPLIEVPTVPDAGYWEERLRTIGARIDATGAILLGLVVSIASGDVWVSGMESNAVRSQLGWRAQSFRVEGVGVSAPADPGENGPWATRLRAVGWAVDRDSLPVREPCIMHLDPGFLVTARVEREHGWTQANWRLTETGMLV
jgi:hypothetical protein